MTYNILLLNDNQHNSIECAKRVLNEIGQKFSRDFVFEEINISDDQNEIIKKAKSAHAVLFDASHPTLCEAGSISALRGVCKELGLYASVRRVGGYEIVNDAFGGIYTCEKGFRNNPTFGREAYDTECYSELEIERVARIAYELTPTRHITLIDKADELATSKLWRKIVTDINEDYPFVNVDMTYIDGAINTLLQSPNGRDTLLCSHLFGDIIHGVLSANTDGVKFSALLGDTTLGMYGCETNKSDSDIICTIAFMLRHSFDMQAEADYLENAMI